MTSAIPLQHSPTTYYWPSDQCLAYCPLDAIPNISNFPSYRVIKLKHLLTINISNNNTLRSVRSMHLTHPTLERKSRTRTQPPYHTTHLTQPDAAPDPQDVPDAVPNTQDAT